MSKQIPEHCFLYHKVFTFGEVCFRRSMNDGVAVMAIQLGTGEALIPLNSLKREFGIADESPDGVMLNLVSASLDFVSAVWPGDAFPLEVRTGEASWQPSQGHLRLALTRLKLGLVSWLAPSSRWAKLDADLRMLHRLADDAELHEAVQAAAKQGAEQLGLGCADEVMQLVEDLSRELSFIEALRDGLMLRVERLCQRLGRLGRRKMGPQQMEMLALVNRLSGAAVQQIRARFEDVDGQTGEIAAMLRNVESQRSFIRSTRDWLYRSQRAWQPLLDQWEHAAEELACELGHLLSTTYRFLAPRFMPAKEWLMQPKTPRREMAEMGVSW